MFQIAVASAIPAKKKKINSMGFFQNYVKCKVVWDALYICMYALSV